MNPIIVMSSHSKADKDKDVEFAINSGFHGLDWSFDPNRMPFSNNSKDQFLEQIRKLYNHCIEVRFHTPFLNVEIGHRDDSVSQWAMELYLRTLELIAEVGGQFLTLHIGLGTIPDEDICLIKVEENLRALKTFGLNRKIIISLENLAHGPTSIPELWMEILESVDLPATFDFGHAKGCDSVVKGLWTPLEMVCHVKDRLLNAHIYKEENGRGHIPPETIDDLGTDLLDALIETSCRWWVVELQEKKAALHTKEMLDTYLKLKGAPIGIEMNYKFSGNVFKPSSLAALRSLLS